MDVRIGTTTKALRGLELGSRMTNPRGKIVETKVGYDCVEILLDNGVKVILCSNPGYIHVHLSNINLDAATGGDNIGIATLAANQLDIKYVPHKQ